MKPFQLFIALLTAALPDLICAVGFEWEPRANVEIPTNAAVHSPNGLRRVQGIDLPTMESTSSASATEASGSTASSSTETEAPTTVMVLLPDNLAMSYSGSGSVMFFDGSVDNEDEKSTNSDTIGDDVSGSASAQSFGMATAVSAFTILFALVMA